MALSGRFCGAVARCCRLRRCRHAHNAAEPEVPGRGLDRLALTRRRPIAKWTGPRRAQVTRSDETASAMRE